MEQGFNHFFLGYTHLFLKNKVYNNKGSESLKFRNNCEIIQGSSFIKTYYFHVCEIQYC